MATSRSGTGGVAFTMRTEDPRRAPATEDARDGNRVQSVDRAVLLLRAISTSAHPPTAWELARTCGINRMTDSARGRRINQSRDPHAMVTGTSGT